ncbi:MAG: lipid IV(A) 3-deoxy-D-manno-octulosonic acid transferase [Legionellales bacterium]
MRFFYSLILYLLTPFLIVRLWWKGKQLPAYRGRILERFYLGSKETKPVDVWVHAVSLGEVIAAIPLIDAVLSKNHTILVTTMTPTGSERVTMRFGDAVAHQYVPYDLPGVLKRFFRQVKPRVGIIMETELWPNLIHQAQAAKIPLLLANARLSESSFRGYKKLKWFFKPLLNQFTAILAQSEDDAQRFMALGTHADKVRNLGNMKFDLQTHNLGNLKFKPLKNQWGAQRVVVVAASTHDKEESQLFACLERLQKAIPGVIFLCAPRHPERFQTVYQLSVAQGFNTGLLSNPSSITPDTEVVVLDCLGELLHVFQISDYAFVGGSFVPVGGHNVLEPIAMNIPVISGTYVNNFKSICHDLVEAQAIQLVPDAEALVDVLITLQEDSKLRQQMVQNARGVLERNKGSVERHLQCIEAVLSNEPDAALFKRPLR